MPQPIELPRVSWTGCDILLIFTVWISGLIIFPAVCALVVPPEHLTQTANLTPQNPSAVNAETAKNAGNQHNAAHPLAQMLHKNRSPLAWILAFAAAVIAAPIFEEWTFRFLLQNWLEKKMSGAVSESAARKTAVFGTSLFFAVIHGGSRAPQTADTLYYAVTAAVLADFAALAAGIVLLRTVRQVKIKETFFGSGKFFRTGFFRSAALCGGLVLCIMVLSMVLSAAVQTGWKGINTDPVPIFFLSLLFGGLYCRTRNLSYSILLHAGLNGISLLLVFLNSLL